MDMNSKEQLLYFFLNGRVSLSQYDYKFMANLQGLIQNENRVTTNQAKLFDRLVEKYTKQLTKHGFTVSELMALPWKTVVVESTSEYTGARVWMSNDAIRIRVPFNKQFITAFRNVGDNPFNWDKDEKLYTAPFSTTALKVAYSSLPVFFKTVKYDNTLLDIINDVKQYENMTWDPTVYEVNGRYVLVAANAVVAEKVGTIETMDMPTAYRMSLLGVKLSGDILRERPDLAFASETKVEVDIENLRQVADYIRSIGSEVVVKFGRGLLYDRKLKDEAEPLFAGIPIVAPNAQAQHSCVIYLSTSNYMTANYPIELSKLVLIKNSRTVEVR